MTVFGGRFCMGGFWWTDFGGRAPRGRASGGCAAGASCGAATLGNNLVA